MATRFYKGTKPLLSQPSIGGGKLGRVYVGGQLAYGVEPSRANPIPVDGYSFVFDFSNDNNQITFDGTKIASIRDEGDNYDAAQSTSAKRPEWNSDGYLDGGTSASDYFLNIDDLITPIFTSRPLATNSYTIFTITNESDSRKMPLGVRADSNERYEIFFNDSAGRRDMIYRGQADLSGVTNNDAEDTIIFGTNRNASNLREIYRWGTTETSATSSPGSGIFDANTSSRIGATSRGTDGQYSAQTGFGGKIYCVGMYPKVLSSQERQDIKDWAVNKWGLTLQS